MNLIDTKTLEQNLLAISRKLTGDPGKDEKVYTKIKAIKAELKRRRSLK